jgi:hypothetical protein
LGERGSSENEQTKRALEHAREYSTGRLP